MPVESETRIMTHVETSDVNFTTDNETLRVTKPDLTLLSPDPTVSDDPGTASSVKKHTLSAPVLFETHGAYRLVWGFTKDADTNPYYRPEYVFVATRDIWTMTRGILYGVSAVSTKPSDATLSEYYVQITRFLQSMYADCVPDYSLLALPDAEYFDVALAYVAASRYATFHPDEFPAGPKRRVTQGPVTWEYQSRVWEGPEDAWLVEAYNSLNLISCVAAQLATFNANVTMFDTAGPRSDVQTKGPRYGINQLYVVARQEQLVWSNSSLVW